MKKMILTLSCLLILVVNCGGGNEEAKELLKRILTLVGIPQNIVVNICQDTNGKGICGLNDLQTKISLRKDETEKSLWDKVTLNESNQYFLENYDPTKKILLELQNQESFRYDDGKFTFLYNPETQELSILQAMVDSGYLKQSDVSDIKESNAVDDFYFVLLRDTYSNMNRLRAKGVDNKDAVAKSLKEMADELLFSGLSDDLTDKLNSCGDNQECIDRVLEEVSSNLLIEKDEVTEIAILKGNPFISKWKTDNSGVSENNQITIPTIGSEYKYDVVWGDGTNERDVNGTITHSYLKEGNYTVEVYGEFPQIYFSQEEITDSRKIISILEWGDIKWKSMNQAFFSCSNLKVEAEDKPDLSKVTSLDSMFNGASLFDLDISDWNISNISTMKNMFSDVTLSTENYDSLLINWSKSSPQYGVTFDGGNSHYSANSEVERSILTNHYGWHISDSGCDISCAY